jgi:hypothetical protein
MEEKHFHTLLVFKQVFRNVNYFLNLAYFYSYFKIFFLYTGKKSQRENEGKKLFNSYNSEADMTLLYYGKFSSILHRLQPMYNFVARRIYFNML